MMMQLGAEGVFVGSGIFKSGNPAQRAAAIVKATTFYDDPDVIAKVSRGLGEAMVGINVDDIPQPHRLAERGWYRRSQTVSIDGDRQPEPSRPARAAAHVRPVQLRSGYRSDAEVRADVFEAVGDEVRDAAEAARASPTSYLDERASRAGSTRRRDWPDADRRTTALARHSPSCERPTSWCSRPSTTTGPPTTVLDRARGERARRRAGSPTSPRPMSGTPSSTTCSRSTSGTAIVLMLQTVISCLRI